MAADWLSAEQRASYGRFAGEPTKAQLDRYFTFDAADREAIDSHRREHNRLGFAVQLGTVRFLGTFIASLREVPQLVVDHVARQLGVPASGFSSYGQREQTQSTHVVEIQRRYGYRPFGAAERDELAAWLFTRACSSTEGPSVLFDLATARLVEQRILLPGASIVSRLVLAARDRAARELHERIVAGATVFQLARLDALLDVPEGERQSELERLRRSPSTLSADALAAALSRVRELAALQLEDIDLSGVPASRLRALARYGIVTRALRHRHSRAAAGKALGAAASCDADRDRSAPARNRGRRRAGPARPAPGQARLADRARTGE